MAALAQTAALVKVSTTGLPLVRKFLAKGTITQGMPVHYSATDGGVKASGNTGLGGQPVLGIALESVSTGQYCLVCLSDDLFEPGATMIAGDTIWLHATAGAITKTAADLASGATNVVLGVAMSATQMKLRPLTGAAIP